MGDFSIDYQDDDDKERDRLMRQFLGSAAPAPAPEAPQTRVEATGRAAQAEPDEIGDALKARALASLTEPSAQGGQVTRKMADGPSWDVGIAPAAALLLDAFVNKGRGAGEITGAAVNSMNADRRDQQQRLDRIAEIEARRKDNDPMAALVSYENLKAREKDLNEVKLARVAQAGATQRAKLDPTSDEAQGAIQMAYGQSDAHTRAAANVKHELNDRTGDDRADLLAKGAQAIADVKHGNAPRVASDKADEIEVVTPATAGRAGAMADAELPAKNAAQDHAYALAHPGAASGPVAIPGSHIFDPAAYARLEANPSERDKIIQHLTRVRKLDQSLGDMESTRSGNGVMLASGGDKTKFDLGYQGAIGAMTGIANSGVLNATEYPRYQKDVPSSFEAMDEIKDSPDILARFLGMAPASPKKDTTLERIQAMRGTLRGLGEEGLRGYGIAPDWDGQQTAPPAASPARLAAPAALPAPNALPEAGDQLSVTGNGRKAAGPLVSDVLAGGGKGPGLDENGLSTGKDQKRTHHYRSSRTGKLVAVDATDSEVAVRTGLDWVD
jgi:hypothetical protein